MTTMSGPLVLGISADFHDSAAAITRGGVPLAAVEEERFSRIKHDSSIPRQSIRYCLEAADATPADLDAVVFFQRPFTAYERILTSHSRVGPGGVAQLSAAIGSWSRSKIWIGLRIERVLREFGGSGPRLMFCPHHLSHAASAYYPSGHLNAAILCLDGVGEWASGTIGHGVGSRIEIVAEQRFPNSLGLMYSAATSFCGFAVNDGEYKMMGLAPYGRPRFSEAILDEAVTVFDDGSVQLDPRWFRLSSMRRMTTDRWNDLFEGPALELGGVATQREADIAASFQAITEQAVVAAAVHAKQLTDADSLCLAGGVAFNCVATRRLRDARMFDSIWTQPAAGDAGAALGAALWATHQVLEYARPTAGDLMSGSALGPSYSSLEIGEWLRSNRIAFETLDDGELMDAVASLLASGKIIGWFQGRGEFGPRALGHRSILADPRSRAVAGRINRLVKGREGFRPFAPAVQADHASDWFELADELPYMTEVVTVKAFDPPADDIGTFRERLERTNSPIPAVTHIDGTARVQTVDRNVRPRFWELIEAFRSLTGCPVVLNTSFNRAGEPIVGSPYDALQSARRCGLDAVVLENHLVIDFDSSEPGLSQSAVGGPT